MTNRKAAQDGREDLDKGGAKGEAFRPEILFREDLDCDIIEIDDHTWAIHGNIPVDGEVIIAEFDRLEQAEEVLASLRPDRPGAQPTTLDQPDGSRTLTEDLAHAVTGSSQGGVIHEASTHPS